jgi:hypothetical protein
MKNGYNPKVVTAFFASHEIPEPVFELRFNPLRRWRFDISWDGYSSNFLEGWKKNSPSSGGIEEGAWERQLVALEVQGGIWTAGRHSRGAAMLKEWEKLNEAAILGWRIIYCQPKDLLTAKTAKTIKRALNL